MTRGRAAPEPLDDAHPDPRDLGTSLGDNPLTADELLAETFFRPEPPAKERAPAKPKPTHYKVISISLYQEDLERLTAMVAELKRRGYTKASRSQLIRFALDTVDLDAMPRSY